MFENITDRKRAEEALQKSEEKYRSLVESTEDSIYLVDRNGTYLFANEKQLSRLGSPADKVIGKTYGEFHSLDDTKEFVGKLEEVFETGEAIQLEHRSVRDDRYFLRTLSPVKGPDGNITSVTVVSKDITERKKGEEALRQSEERYRTILKDIVDGYYEVDIAGNLTFFNDSLCEMMGYTRDELMGMNNRQLMDQEDAKEVYQTMNKVYRTGKPTKGFDWKLTRKDSSDCFVETSVSLIMDSEGEPIGFRGILRDITEKKQVELALQESKEDLDKAQKMAHIGNWSRDLNLNRAQWSDELYRILGLTPGDPAQPFFETFLFRVPPEDRERVTSVLKEAAEKKQAFDFEFRTIPIEGSERIIRNRGEVEYDETGAPVRLFGTDQDITETRRLEDQLQKARKMEAMGLMAGGIAHDLNNILSGIVSYPELLLMDLPEDSPFRNPIKVMQDSGMRAADVVADLMTIARGAASSKEVLDLNSTVREYLDSAEHKKLESTHSFETFKTQFDSDLLNVNGSRTHIKKTLMNLVTNASEAIEGVGTVTISTANRYLDEPLKGYEDVRTGEYAVLGVSDDGSGISPRDLERIFEPFYTKKVMDRSGTGLGLAVVWNSMQDHDGYINVKTSEKGTVFELYFPVTRDELTQAEEEVPREDYQGHGEKILVVDDEENQRVIACALLARLGYVAEAVSSGEEAIEYVKEHPVDLIVLDMVMPKGINGRKTYEEIIKIRPGQKAIIASGFAKTREVDIAQELGAGKYIKKPYVLGKIGVAVKKELEK